MAWVTNWDGPFVVAPGTTATWAMGTGPAASYSTVALTFDANVLAHVRTMPPRDPAAEQSRQRERDARRHAIQMRSEALLESLLSAVQLIEWRQHQWFTVVGSLGGRYRIRVGTAGNVRLLDESDNEVMHLCAHPDMEVFDGQGLYRGSLPTADVMLGQLLLLSTDELEFHRHANVSDAMPDATRCLRHIRDALAA